MTFLSMEVVTSLLFLKQLIYTRLSQSISPVINFYIFAVIILSNYLKSHRFISQSYTILLFRVKKLFIQVRKLLF